MVEKESVEGMCEFCGVSRAIVYCKSDFAGLCFDCDGYVHCANSLSRRHSRWLICNKCSSQPALVGCMDDKLCLCQMCHWNATSCSTMEHQLQPLNSYSDCPSFNDFTTFWSPLFYSSSFSTTFDLTSLPLNQNQIESCTNLNEIESCIKLNEIEALNVPKDSSGFKDIKLNDLCKDFNIDDVPIHFEGCDGCPEGPSEYHLDDVGTDCLLIDTNLSITDSNSPDENAFEASSSDQYCMVFQSSRVGGSPGVMQAMNNDTDVTQAMNNDTDVMQAMNNNTNCLLMNPSCNTSINLGFPTHQVHSTISLSSSNITGETIAPDYQDCGLSPVFLTADSPWDSNLDVNFPAQGIRRR